MISRKNYALLTVIVLSTIVVLIIYGKFLVHPNQYCFNDTGDGIKNYYTYAYHIKNDSSLINFEGMNYPYGEHFLYTDCHPLLTTLLRPVAKLFPSINNYTIGLLNFLMIFSIIVTAVIIYYLLLEFKIHEILAALSAIGISLLAPQYLRIIGHYALSYSFFFPLSWLLLIKFLNSENKLKWSIFLLINNLAWLFIHQYLGIIAISFQLVILLLDMIKKYPSYKEWLSKLYYFFQIIVIPIAGYLLYSTLTDIHTGRTDHPSGFFFNPSSVRRILMPHKPPFNDIFEFIFGIEKYRKFEGESYIGLATELLLIGFIIYVIVRFIKKRKITISNDSRINKMLLFGAISSVLLFLFSMGIPFKNHLNLLDTFPLIRSFRATGRFSWPIFFFLTLYGVYIANYFYNELKERKLLKYILILFVPLLLFVEGYGMHKFISKLIDGKYNIFNTDLLPQEIKESFKVLDNNDFQAILPLPFYYYGSESFSRHRQNQVMKYSMAYSFHNNIPIIGANLTRTSIPESKNIVQLVSPNFYDKELVNDLDTTRPLLILESQEQKSKYEIDIIKRAELIFESGYYNLYKLEAKKLFEDNTREMIGVFEKKQNKLQKSGDFWVNDTTKQFIHFAFDTIDTRYAFRGEGALVIRKKGYDLPIVRFEPGTFRANTEYEFGMWMNNSIPNALNLGYVIVAKEYDHVNNKWTYEMWFPEYAEVINGDWSLFEFSYTMEDTTRLLDIVGRGSPYYDTIVVIDDLLIREKGLDVYRIDEESDSTITRLFYNNHDIRLFD